MAIVYKGIERIGQLLEQVYERYLPTAFDESLTILQKINKLIEYLNQVGLKLNLTLELIELLQKEMIDFENRIENEIIPANLEKILNEWFLNGKLAEIIGQVFDMKADKVDVEQLWILSTKFNTIQEGINFCIANKKRLFIPSGVHNLTTGLVADGSIQIMGVYSGTELNFSGMSTGVALTIGSTVAVNGTNISNLKLKGNANINGLKLNGSSNVNQAVTDSVFSNLRVENFAIGLTGVYSWCNLFENVRFQSCTQPIAIGSQFNNTEFMRCSLVTSSIPSRFTNCEGINFTSPNIANVTGDAFTLFQSNVSIVNPYYEYISGNLAYVGSTSEVLESSFTSLGGRSTDTEVRIALKGHRSKLMLKNLSPNSKFIVDDGNEGATPYKYSASIELDTLEYENDFLFKYDGTKPVPFNNSYGGIVLTKNQHPDNYMQITTDAGITSGLNLGTLTIGQRYVFMYSVRKQAGADLTLKLGALPSIFIDAKTTTEDFEVRYIPFTAKGDVLRLMWTANTTLDISFLGIVKGSKFPKLSKIKEPIFMSAPPTTGTWSTGKHILNSSPVAGGYSGWVCTLGGTSGTWKGTGLIQA